MGCTAVQAADGDCASDEYPVHSVTLTKDFWMAETETTQAQWQALMGNNGHYRQDLARLAVGHARWHTIAVEQ